MFREKEGFWASGPLVKKEERRTLVSTKYGQISVARVTDSINGSYLLHFFTLEPNALFLPVILHADMVFYVQTGSGRLSWTDEGNLKCTGIRRGDVHRLQHGSVFFIQSNLETDQRVERLKLRIHAIFVNTIYDQHEPETGPYSSIRDMVIGFDRNVLQAAFKDVIDDLLNGTKQPAIIHGVTKTKRKAWDREVQFISGILGSRSFNLFELNKKKKKDDANLFNIFKEDKDFENCNGWSTTVTKKKLSAMRDSNIGLFMVNLTTGSMMGPHWNPKATEIAIVLQGRGMVRVVCSSISNETSCRNTRFQVAESDIFVVPRFHPMAQMAFNNETFVFMGFSTSAKMNHPQYLAGQASVLRTLDRDVMAMSFGVENTTFDQLLAPQHESVILGCTSCAEEELRIMKEEIEKEREEGKKREEEEARKKEEEVARKQKEERRKREEEEEAARIREEEAAARKETKEREKQQEEETSRREEEEKQRREEEEVARKEKERRERKEAARRAEERERREQEEEAVRKEKEERQRQRWEQEEASAKKEEEERQRREQEEAASREEEEERERREQEATTTRREEEERERQEQEEAERREEDVRQRREQEEKVARREEKERERREQEEAVARREEDERQRQHHEEEASRREKQEGGRSEEEQAAEEERRMEEEARREQEDQGHGDIRG